VPNDVSSWDTNWVENYGGYDDPDPLKQPPFSYPLVRLNGSFRGLP
jgi:hypothetical protein